MKTIQDFDRELEALHQQHQRVWGEICQLRAERNLALTQYARANARSEPAVAVQMSEWNNSGHRNDNFDMAEIIR